jgi:DUF4097 and DUF4098 domain-containing protein YvlB
MNSMFRYVAVAAMWGAIATPAAAQAQQNPDRVTVPFSDPGRPGSLKVEVVQGSLTIKGANRRDVVIQAASRGASEALRGRQTTPPPPGLRRLTQASGFSIEESDNEMSIESSSFSRTLDLEIEVPAKTNLEVSVVNGGTISVSGVEGELEIENVNGAIALTNVAGSVVAHSVNGSVTATIARATPDAPMAFTSLNGTVDVTLPPTIKASLKLRSDQGDVFTDFDIQMNPGAARQGNDTRRGNGRVRIDVNNAIYGTINGGGPDFEIRSFNGSVYVRKGK